MLSLHSRKVTGSLNNPLYTFTINGLDRVGTNAIQEHLGSSGDVWTYSLRLHFLFLPIPITFKCVETGEKPYPKWGINRSVTRNHSHGHLYTWSSQ